MDSSKFLWGYSLGLNISVFPLHIQNSDLSFDVPDSPNVILSTELDQEEGFPLSRPSSAVTAIVRIRLFSEFKMIALATASSVTAPYNSG